MSRHHFDRFESEKAVSFPRKLFIIRVINSIVAIDIGLLLMLSMLLHMFSLDIIKWLYIYIHRFIDLLRWIASLSNTGIFLVRVAISVNFCPPGTRQVVAPTLWNKSLEIDFNELYLKKPRTVLTKCIKNTYDVNIL